MSINLRVFLIIFALFLAVVTIYILKKGRMPEKYSLLWFLLSLIILLVALAPNFIGFISNVIGFEVMSNMIVGIILVLLTFLTMALTIIISGQRKKITLLIQELSLLKSEMEKRK